MKKIFVFITLLLIGSVLAGCGQDTVRNSPTATSTLAPVSTTQPVHQGDTPNQLHFYSFEKMKEVDEVMQGDPETLEAYYEEHLDCLACYSWQEAAELFDQVKDTVILYPKDNTGLELRYLEKSAILQQIILDYLCTDKRLAYQVLILPNDQGNIQEGYEEYQDREVVYQWHIPNSDIECSIYESVDGKAFSLYVGFIFLEDYQMVFTIDRVRDESIDGFYEVRHDEVDLSKLEDLEFRTVREILNSIG